MTDRRCGGPSTPPPTEPPNRPIPSTPPCSAQLLTPAPPTRTRHGPASRAAESRTRWWPASAAWPTCRTRSRDLPTSTGRSPLPAPTWPPPGHASPTSPTSRPSAASRRSCSPGHATRGRPTATPSTRAAPERFRGHRTRASRSPASLRARPSRRPLQPRSGQGEMTLTRVSCTRGQGRRYWRKTGDSEETLALACHQPARNGAFYQGRTIHPRPHREPAMPDPTPQQARPAHHHRSRRLPAHPRRHPPLLAAPQHRPAQLPARPPRPLPPRATSTPGSTRTQARAVGTDARPAQTAARSSRGRPRCAGPGRTCRVGAVLPGPAGAAGPDGRPRPARPGPRRRCPHRTRPGGVPGPVRTRGRPRRGPRSPRASPSRGTRAEGLLPPAGPGLCPRPRRPPR